MNKCVEARRPYLWVCGGLFALRGFQANDYPARSCCVTALRVNPLAVGACALYGARCPALAIKGKLSEWRPLIGPASCTGARRVHTWCTGRSRFERAKRARRREGREGEREREGGDNSRKDWRKIKREGIDVSVIS